MADLTELEAAQQVKLVGQNSTGTETLPIGATAVGSENGLNGAPLKYAPHLTTTGSLSALNATLSTSILDGLGTAGVIITGTWVGTITFQGSVDGTNYVAMTGQPLGVGLLGSTTTVNGSFRLNITGLKSVRVLMSAYTSGTASVTIQCTAEAGFTRSIATLVGGTDGSTIGNVGDRIKVDSVTTVITSVASANILKQSEFAVTVKVETDAAGVTYTVPSGKSFNLMTFGGSYDTQSPMYLRFKKQTGGAGAFATLFRVTLKQHGQDESNFSISLPLGILVGAAGDVFKITFESALAKGTLWTGFTGVEF